MKGRLPWVLASLAIVALGLIVLSARGNYASSDARAPQSVDPPFGWLERVVGALEAAEGEAATDGSATPEQVRRAVVVLDSLIARDSLDVTANALYARLGRVLPWDARDGSFGIGLSAERGAELLSSLAAIDRALMVEPRNAAFNYVRARLCGAPISGLVPKGCTLNLLDHAQAVVSARRAVALDSTRDDYRKALAIYLMLGPHPEEAEPVVRHSGRELSRLRALLEHWNHVPMPAKAASCPKEVSSTADMFAANGLTDWTIARVRSFVFPGSAADLESFYRKTWKDFRLFAQQDEGAARQGLRFYHQELVWKKDQFGPSRKPPKSDTKSSGILMIVSETLDAPEHVRQLEPVPVGDVYCSVTLVNMRRVK